MSGDMTLLTLFVKADYSLFEMVNVVHQHTFTIFTCFFFFCFCKSADMPFVS